MKSISVRMFKATANEIERRSYRRVSRVVVTIPEMSREAQDELHKGLVAPALGTPLEGAAWEFNVVPLCMSCKKCSHRHSGHVFCWSCASDSSCTKIHVDRDFTIDDITDESEEMT